MVSNDFSIGDVYEFKDRLFRLIRFDPYTRKDGVKITLAVWQARCTRCGNLLEVTVGSNQEMLKTYTFYTKRCKPCAQILRERKRVKMGDTGDTSPNITARNGAKNG